MSSSPVCAPPVKRKREEACQDNDETDAPSDVWGLCRWSDYVYIDTGYKEYEDQKPYSLIITKKLYDMIHMIGYTTTDIVDKEYEVEFDATFSPATPQEIYVLRKFDCDLGGGEYIEDILQQNKEKKGAVWFKTALEELDKSG